MAKYLSSDQARDKSVAAMPTPLGEIHYRLHDEIAWLHIKRADFCRLYATGQERVDLLNAAAPAFFHYLQRMMWEDVLLHLCRVTDPVKSRGHDNLSIMRIPDAIPDQPFRNEMKSLIDDAKRKTQFTREWRNRRLAHEELPAFGGQAAAPLPPANYRDVETALAALSVAMNRIERRYLNESVLYEQSIESMGGVERLIELVANSKQAKRART